MTTKTDPYWFIQTPCIHCGDPATFRSNEPIPDYPMCPDCLTPPPPSDESKVPAWVLIASGTCVGACLVALIDDVCTCRCDGVFHGVLVDVFISI